VKIVIAPDSFKENMTSLQVARAIERGIRRVLPNAKCITVPMADGGEGTVQSLVDGTGGRFVHKQVSGPLGKPVRARYGLLGDGATAVIEMAEASGLPLIEKARRDPTKSSTFGTGELIADALKRGARRIIVGIGGSATNDGGAGMAQALGVRFIDARGRVVATGLGGGGLATIRRIDISRLDQRLEKARVTVACDVDNPLYGPRGAAAVFGPQKGADAHMVKELDANLRHFASLIKAQLGRDVSKLPGGGAAGGLGAGLVAFTGARLRSGVDIVMEAVDLAGALKGADLVITGEGRVDSQTAFGKTPAGVAKAARRARVPVVAIGGGLADDARGVFDHGIHGLASATAREMDLAEAIANSRRYLADAGERVVRLILLGQQMARRRKAKKRS
jgi:glycerate kinase